METELWFNKVGNTGVPKANPDLVYSGGTKSPSANQGNGNSQQAPSTESIVCNKCNDGDAISNKFDVKWRFDKQYVCPEGWTMDKDPCVKTIPQTGGGGVLPYNEGMNTASLGNDSEIMKILPYVGIAVLGYFLLIK